LASLPPIARLRSNNGLECPLMTHLETAYGIASVGF